MAEKDTTALEADQVFQKKIQAALCGEHIFEDKTLMHFVGRFKAGQQESAGVTKNVQSLEAQLAEARMLQAKLTGFLEGLAVDLRHLYDGLETPQQTPEAQNNPP